ncbi:MAG: hypothetical protein AAF961_17585, partial [Planctomycetota bacterium]
QAATPGKIAEARTKLEEQIPKNVADLTAMELPELEQLAEKTDRDVRDLRDAKTKWDQEPKRREKRMSETPQLILDAETDLEQATDELNKLGVEDIDNAASMSTRSRLLARRRAARATILALEREQSYYRQSSELIQLLRDDAARRLAWKEKRLTDLRNEINRRRQLEAKNRVAEAQDDATVSRPEVIAQLAIENQRLAEQWKAITDKLADVDRQLDDANEQLNALVEEVDNNQKMIELNELSEAAGALLREQRNELPDLRVLRRKRALRDEEKSEVSYRLYELHDQRSELADLDQRADEIISELDSPTAEEQDEVRRLLEMERKLLDDLIDDYSEYSTKLNRIASVEEQLRRTTQEFAQFINARVLWIRSCHALKLSDLAPAAGATRWTLDPLHWRDAGRAILKGCRK